MTENKYDVSFVNYSLPPLEKDKKSVLIPVPRGALILVAMLENKGFSVQFKDYQLSDSTEPLKEESFCSFLSDTADIIGISSQSHLLPILINSLKMFKKKYPNKKIILGGPCVANIGHELIEEFDWVDYVVEGEAERIFVDLVTALKKGDSLNNFQGLIYKENDNLVNNKILKHRIKDLDSLPLPAYNVVNPEDYNYPTIETSRGCAYSCKFCHFPLSKGTKIYFRNMDKIIQELKLISNFFKSEKLKIIDDNFVCSKKRTIEFCNAYKKANYNMKFGIYTRINTMDQKLMKELSETGCCYVLFGLESGSNKILKKINKKFTIEEAVEVVLESKKYFEKVVATFIWNFPFESFNEFMLTFRIIHNLTKGGVTTVYYELMPFPTIELYSDNKDDLYYDPDHCYSLLNNWYASVNYSKESKNLIRQYPSIFSSFYSYKSPDESVKRKLFFFYLYYNKDNTYFNDFLIKVKNKYFMISNKKFMYSDLVNVDLDNIDLKQFNSLKEVFIRLKLDENLISNQD